MAELRVYEDCGHFPWVEKKGEFLGDVGAFLGVEL
jgi:pimeloyl-ACP methyl ester carboxylesterase